MVKLQAFKDQWCSLSIISVILLCLQDKVSKAQEVKDLAMSSLAQAIEDEKKEQWRAEGRSMLFDAKRVSSIYTASLFIMFCFIFKQQYAASCHPALTLSSRSIIADSFTFIDPCWQLVQVTTTTTQNSQRKLPWLL